MSLIYRCDGPGCKKPEGEPRGPASALHMLLRLWRGVKRFMARCAGEGM